MPSINLQHRVTVAKLRELLTQLRDDDVLIPNAVANLLIVREQKSVGFIDLLHAAPNIEIFEDDTDLGAPVKDQAP